MSNRIKGIIAIIASTFGFALMAMCVRLCDDYGNYIPCFEKSFFRNIVALIIAAVVGRGRPTFPVSKARCPTEKLDWGRPTFPVSKARCPTEKLDWGRPRPQIDKSNLLILLARCVLGTLGIFANFYALSHIPIAEGQTLNKTAPFFTLIFAWLFLGERASLRQLGVVATAFAGALLVIKPGFAGAASLPLGMGLLGGLCAGGAYAAVRALGREKVRPAFIVLVFSAFSCLASIPLTLVDYVPLTLAQVMILIGAGAGAAIGQFGITLAYRFAAPREIAVFDYTNIVFTAVLGYLVFGQLPDVWSFLGMSVIILAAFRLSR